jgi:polygalacturonase
MKALRRDFLKMGGGAAALALPSVPGWAQSPQAPGAQPSATASAGGFDVRAFGAKGDGNALDTDAIRRAVDAAAQRGGGVVRFPAGTYASYSVRLKTGVYLSLEAGATLLAASVPLQGTNTGGYDAAEPQGSFEPYQDYGHNHWHNSLIWGENVHDCGIFGPGRIWGKGLSRGHEEDTDLPKTNLPGVGNKAIALKNCHNILLRDFSILEGGWFGILATGVDNMTIDNLIIDTNRDGMDIDCCRNVRVSNCSVNSPYDDAICPKSSYALGQARATENLTITNCYVTGKYLVGSMLDGSWKPYPAEARVPRTGGIKMGTESNGGFKNITISNCVLEGCHGFALETVDGALCEDITFTGITMRGLISAPLFLRLGSRMRGPRGAAVGALRRVVISNLISSGGPLLPSLFSGISAHPVEDIKVSDVYLGQVGGAGPEMAAIDPAAKENAYPEATMFGPLPACGFFLRNCQNLEFGAVEIATAQADARPLFWLGNVDGADFFRITGPRQHSAPAFALRNVTDFRVFGSRRIPDKILPRADREHV